MYGSGWTTWPTASSPASSSSLSVCASRSRAPAAVAVLARLRADHDEAARLLARPCARAGRAARRCDGLVGHDERALDVVALGVEVDDHVLDRAPRGAPDAVDQPLAQPARARLGVGGDDDLVVVVLAQGVHGRGVGVRVHHLAVRLDAGLAQQRERHLEPVLGRLAHHRVVDHVAVLGLVLRADHVHVDLVARRRGASDGVDQRPAGHRLVGDYEDALHLVGRAARRHPPPARAPSRPPAPSP